MGANTPFAHQDLAADIHCAPRPLALPIHAHDSNTDRDL